MCQTNRGVTVWFTGLSGAGKTTVAVEVEKQLQKRNTRVQRLDGDIVRESLTSDLGFSKEDRNENIKRNTFVAKLLTKHDVVTLCSFISPYRSARDYARQEIEEVGEFVEVFVNPPLEVCEERDVKGLYQQARDGKIANFTGISDPYQAPENPDLELRTDQETLEESAQKVIDYLAEQNYI
ncbi:adenylyl-sulfate kinase [Natroniella sulfidigena]|uniref:adenylyl-sulfate kinase n=1 Tax=Natroniella sulfidigena TaxID=723921 RepID=UPI00200B8049|nr:adenylyl-sulfate kinase [Natroniella sulfidigena]MCK8816111.1 adenylyl-sulfate kinase [Natroniella sulfidigena]